MEKRKHRFNIIDVLIIALLAFLVFLAVRGLSEEDKGKYKSVALRYVIRTDDIAEELSDNVSVGDGVFERETGKQIGKVVSCDVRNSVYIGTSAEGNTVNTEIPGYRCLYITVEADAENTGDGYSVEGIQISSGKKYTVMLPSLYCSTECINVEALSSEN